MKSPPMVPEAGCAGEAAAAALLAATDQNGLAAKLGDDATRDLIRTALRVGMTETGILHFRVTRGAFLAAAPAP